MFLRRAQGGFDDFQDSEFDLEVSFLELCLICFLQAPTLEG